MERGVVVSRPVPIDLAAARDFLLLNTESGELFWKKKPNRNIVVGSEAGTVRPDRYRVISINRQRILAHRLVWALMHGEQPPDEIDHIDGDPSNNRPSNLRAASHAQNVANQKSSRRNTSGVRGVYFSRARGKWVAQITAAGDKKYIGIFSSISDAQAAYNSAAERNFGAFVRR